jgi:hypothetical protein
MSRTTARVATAVVAAAVIFGLSACGSDDKIPSKGNPAVHATSSSAAPSSGVPAEESAALPTSTEGPNPVASADAPYAAQAYAEQALGDLHVLNAASLSDSINSVSTFFTPNFAAALIAQDGSIEAFRVLPWKRTGLNDGVPFTDAKVAVNSVTVTDQTATYTRVEVIAAYDWTFGDGWTAHGTRTYDLTMVPGTDAAGSNWQVDAATGTDSEWTYTQ